MALYHIAQSIPCNIKRFSLATCEHDFMFNRICATHRTFVSTACVVEAGMLVVALEPLSIQSAGNRDPQATRSLPSVWIP